MASPLTHFKGASTHNMARLLKVAGDHAHGLSLNDILKVNDNNHDEDHPQQVNQQLQPVAFSVHSVVPSSQVLRYEIFNEMDTAPTVYGCQQRSVSFNIVATQKRRPKR
mmetsp:Transcript_31847/g.73175  ORF Transcript_31847/g.73175 Transcript_31847/m.73175 type:complete len:109 (-) Transcript_31847:444-770(-)